MPNIIYQNKILFPEILWERPVHPYKAQAGKVLVLAGSKGKASTAILTCEAVFRSGTGILVLGFPESLKNTYEEILPEAMTLSLTETPSGSLAKKAESQIIDQSKVSDVAIIGPGLSTNNETIQLIWQLLFEPDIPIVLDGDGIIALAKGIEVMRSKENLEFVKDYFAKHGQQLIITIDAHEAIQLIKILKTDDFGSKKIDVSYLEAHKLDIIPVISKILSALIVLKSNNITIASPNGQVLVDKSNTGSGSKEFDALSGIIGSFVAQNPKKIFEATATAVYLFELAEKLTKEKTRGHSISASSIIRYLPEAIKLAESSNGD